MFLEAMAHAKPVIGGAHGGALDVIQDGVTGYAGAARRQQAARRCNQDVVDG